ncbi:MAG: hypothetical protein HOC20_03885 [Chloroflexi bacterium]|jgi:hypothetical protein|nr:hypothetical protein [Chloroflexota bacterium]
MASIYFAGTYKPMMCGIADYTSYLTRMISAGKWGVLSFDLKKYGGPRTQNNGLDTDRVWYGIPGSYEFSSSHIRQGLEKLDADNDDSILWLQHETGIWSDNQQLITMLKELNIPKVVTFHTLHFQSTETPSGLRQQQFDLLQKLLPHVDAITVFSRGVYHAVTSAFPEYASKVHVLKHGIHSYPDVYQLSREEAKEKLHDFLLYEADIDQETKEKLHTQRTFLDPNTVVLGQTGFLCQFKQSESLYLMKDNLQKMIPNKNIVAVRIGSARDDHQKQYAQNLREQRVDSNKYLIETMLPQDILPLAQRAFDINFCWPSECTQSGILAHALGAGATIAGRDLEGVGETLEEAGQLVDTDLLNLLLSVRDLILNPKIALKAEEKALKYAIELSWKRQALKHHKLAQNILHPTPSWIPSFLNLKIHSRAQMEPNMVRV